MGKRWQDNQTHEERAALGAPGPGAREGP
jgi:hypothetical protein